MFVTSTVSDESAYLAFRRYVALTHLPGITSKWWTEELLPRLPFLNSLSEKEFNTHIQQILPYEATGFGLCDEAMQRTWAWLNNQLSFDKFKNCDQMRHIIMLGDERYPYSLRQIDTPPPLLYVLGNIEALTSPQLAVVGTREPSHYGRVQAYKFAFEVSNAGFTITSGLALGIDAISHEAALNAGGPTIGVMAHGLDQFYPHANQSLALAMLQAGGALVSEFSIGIIAQKYFFPRRNRIITGLSLGTLIVEGKIKSGSLISANCALNQGREVYAIPGSIDSPLSEGPHHLIKDGACLVTKPQDLIDVLAQCQLLREVLLDKKSCTALTTDHAIV